MKDLRLIRTLVIATVLMAVASLCHLSGLWGDAQARLAERGTYCLRLGRTYNVNGDLVARGRWLDDNGRWQEVER